MERGEEQRAERLILVQKELYLQKTICNMPDFPMLNIDPVTPDMLGSQDYMDADDELSPMADLIKQQTSHNYDIRVDRIKFLYTNKAKKEGGRYIIGELMVRNEKERVVYDACDYVVIVYHPVWKDLDKPNKFIQLDRLLCGIEIEIKKSGEEAIKKAAYDCREYIDNLHYWGADDVLKSSETVHLAITRHIEESKEKAQNG